MSPQPTLVSIVTDYLSTHADPPEYPEDLTGDREDCQVVDMALEQEFAPELTGHLQRYHQIYEALKAFLNPTGQELLGRLGNLHNDIVSAYETLSWQMGAEVERQLTRRKKSSQLRCQDTPFKLLRGGKP